MISNNSGITPKKQEAFACFQNDRLQEAKVLYTEISGTDEFDAEVWFMLGVINGKLGSHQQAADCFRKSLSIQPNHVLTYLNLGLALRLQGKFKDAAESFKEAIRLDPQNKSAIDAYKGVDYLATRDQILTLTIQGEIKICVPGSLQLMTTYVLLEQEDWFEDEINFVRCLLRSDEEVIDVGANYGIYTLTMAQCVGARGKVWAFEPASSTAGFLRKSIEAQEVSNIECIQAALSNRKGSAQLGLQPNSELNSLVAQSSTQGDSETVQLLILDDCISEHNWGDRFVKKLMPPLIMFSSSPSASSFMNVISPQLCSLMQSSKISN